MRYSKYLPSVALFCLVVTGANSATTPKNERPAKSRDKKLSTDIHSEAGLNIPEWGLAIDAFYDPQLTDLIPGYHIINLVLTNRRNAAIQLDPQGDRWIITDNVGKKHTAKNHVKFIDKDLWQRLPEPLRNRLEYPHIVKPGNFTTIDVFIPKDVDLTNFREVVWKSDFFGKEFNIFTNYEKQISVNEDKDQPLPSNSRPLSFTDDDYIKTRDEILNGTADSKWESMEREIREKMEEEKTFDPSIDEAIIIR